MIFLNYSVVKNYLIEIRRESMKCQYCGKEYVKNESEGIEYLPEFIRKHIEYIPACDCLEKMKEREREEEIRKQQAESIKNRVKKYRDISVVDSKFLKSTFEIADMSEKYMKVALRYAKSFMEKKMDIGIIFYGGVGVGKTFATACIANYLMSRGKSVFVINLGLYLLKLTKEWGQGEMELLKIVENCDLLIIDDFGVEKSLEDKNASWRAEKIYNLIDSRYRCGKPLIISTNLEFDEDENRCEIARRFSAKGKNRIRDRIVEMCYPIKVEGKSRRKVNKQRFYELLKE